MMYIGTVQRIVREGDRSYWLWIPVYYSVSENRYHRVLPDFLVKYKQYTIKTITDAVNDEQDLDLHNLPSDSSRIRWKNLIRQLLQRKSELKRSDDSSSLPYGLQSIHFSGITSHVKVGSTIHRFSTAELGGLLYLSIHKRL